jgi:hypothetical protein
VGPAGSTGRLAKAAALDILDVLLRDKIPTEELAVDADEQRA